MAADDPAIISVFLGHRPDWPQTALCVHFTEDRGEAFAGATSWLLTVLQLQSANGLDAEELNLGAGAARGIGRAVRSIFHGLGEPWAGTHVEVLRAPLAGPFEGCVGLGAGSNKKKRQRAARLALALGAAGERKATAEARVCDRTFQSLLKIARRTLAAPLCLPEKRGSIQCGSGFATLPASLSSSPKKRRGSIQQEPELVQATPSKQPRLVATLLSRRRQIEPEEIKASTSSECPFCGCVHLPDEVFCRKCGKKRGEECVKAEEDAYDEAEPEYIEGIANAHTEDVEVEEEAEEEMLHDGEILEEAEEELQEEELLEDEEEEAVEEEDEEEEMHASHAGGTCIPPPLCLDAVPLRKRRCSDRASRRGLLLGLLGRWYDDSNRNIYEVTSHIPGLSLSVLTRKPSGQEKFTEGLIKSSGDAAAVVWGANYELGTIQRDGEGRLQSLQWRAGSRWSRSGRWGGERKRQFTWSRNPPD